MLDKDQLLKTYAAYFFAIATLIILLAYTVAKFAVVPYLGFIFNPSDGSLIRIFTSTGSRPSLQTNDKLLRVGTVEWDEFKANSRKTLINKQATGEIIEILILRDGVEKSISWHYPGPNRAEIVDRLNSVLILAYAFWLSGLVTILFIRPRDSRWILMIIFLFLTAIWVACGSISAWHIWESAILLRMAIWMCVPVYMHFHWFFPRELRRVPTGLWWCLYISAAVLAGLEWFERLPRNAYYIGFFIALFSTFGLLIFRYIALPKQRQDVRLIVIGSMVAMLPALALSLAGILDKYPWFGGLALIGLPLLPGAYFYNVYYRQIGGLNVRTNRLISLYVYFALIGVPSALIISFIISQIETLEAATFVSVLSSILIALVSIAIFPFFQRTFENRVLRIPHPPTSIISTYSDRITTSLNRSSLKGLLEVEILPSLLIRQSALIQLDEHHQSAVLYSNEVSAIQPLSDVDVSDLVETAGRYMPSSVGTRNEIFRWIRIVLPLKVENKLVGLWLLGSRDPDDLYYQAEISVLETIANHTAIALVNIAQAERLEMLHKANIERQEIERTSLARDLHDEILGQLANLFNSVAKQAGPEFHEHYQKLTARIRQIGSELRPAMLTYGLRSAIEELVDSLSDRVGDEVIISMELPASEIRYPAAIEEHLYRMVQQACENSLRHAQAKLVRIHGSLQPKAVALVIEDDGIGFERLTDLTLEGLLASKHYGLVGMYERAAIIGSELRIDPKPGFGTQIHIKWHAFKMGYIA